MASELRVNTLKDASGNNSVGMSTVAGGSAKAWANVPAGGGSFNDSFNTSSHGDTSTGDGIVNLTNSMSNANYVVTSAVTVNYVNASYSLRIAPVGTKTTSNYREQAGQANSSAVFLFEDRERLTSVNGDLA